jgi:spoIIIJ-associated protein
VSEQTTPAALEADVAESTDSTSTEAAEEPSAAETAPEDSSGEDGSGEDTEESESADPGDQADSGGKPGRMNRLEQEGDIAADYLEDLLDIADLDGDLDMDVEGDRAAVSIVGADLNQLVGRKGEVLEALQELTRLAVYRETGERSRLMLDIGGYRADKRATLEKLAADIVAQVQESGDSVPLEPMTPFERKVVHDVVAAAGLTSESEGEEPRRFVVVLPKS